MVVVLLRKIMLGDQRRFVTHGSKAFRPTARASKLSAVWLLLYSFIATVLPVSALEVVSLSNFWSAKIKVSRFTLDNFRQIVHESGMPDSCSHTPKDHLCSTAPLGHRGRLRDAHAALHDPHAIVGDGLARRQLHRGGEGQWLRPDTDERSRRVADAALRVGGAAALMFVLLGDEFAASVLVRSPTTQVMGTVLFDVWNNGSYPLVAAIALVMALVTSIGVVIAVLIGGSKALSSL
jgi:hypothetical protein